MPSVQTQIPLLYVIACGGLTKTDYNTCGGLSNLFTVRINVLRLHSTLWEGSLLVRFAHAGPPFKEHVATERASIKFRLCRWSAICEYFNWNRCYFRKIV